MKNENGFTVLELVAGLVLMGVLAAFTYSMMMSSVDGFLFASDNADAVREMKPTYDWYSTKLSDINNFDCTSCCFSTNSKMIYEDTSGNTMTLTVNAAATPETLALTLTDSSSNSNTWTMDNLDNIQLDYSTATYTDSSGNTSNAVKQFLLTFTYVFQDGLERDFSIDFSPRGIQLVSDLSACP